MYIQGSSTGTQFGGSESGIWSGPNDFGSLQDNYYPGDFNGDGKTDLLYRASDLSFHVRLSNGTGLVCGSQCQWLPAYLQSNSFGNYSGKYYVGDFNGDGMTDLMFFSTSNSSPYQQYAFYVRMSNGASFGTSMMWID